MTSNLKYFKGSFVFTILSIIIAFSIGLYKAGMELALIYSYDIAILTILEVSLSFDNAVVNATVLQHMDSIWRRRFLTWGIIVAVFGMRLIFPMIILMFAGHLSLYDAIVISFTNPQHYQAIVGSEAVSTSIGGFGGAFLAMVFAKFFIDENKDEHWLSFIEVPLTKFGRLDSAQILFTLILLYGFSKFVPHELVLTYIMSGIFGLITYILADGAEIFFENDENESESKAVGTVVTSVAKAGFAGFMYLEILDASFSFDGVIGAFAITNIIWIMALGLGSGAMFVRSLTVLMVDKGTLNSYKYLEHGALWAIGVLSVILLMEPVFKLPEVVTGLVGAVLILLAFISSVKFNKNNSL